MITGCADADIVPALFNSSMVVLISSISLPVPRRRRFTSFRRFFPMSTTIGACRESVLESRLVLLTVLDVVMNRTSSSKCGVEWKPEPAGMILRAAAPFNMRRAVAQAVDATIDAERQTASLHGPRFAVECSIEQSPYRLTQEVEWKRCD